MSPRPGFRLQRFNKRVVPLHPFTPLACASNAEFRIELIAPEPQELFGLFPLAQQ
jgi:hypothetical protein